MNKFARLVLQPRTCVFVLAFAFGIPSPGMAIGAAISSVGAQASSKTDRVMVTAEVPFLTASRAAMSKMTTDMAVQASGDVDRDFVAMMVPHHQGAIDMATAMVRYGHNEKLRRVAQEIIVTQQREIDAMLLAIGESVPPRMPSPGEPSSVPTQPDHPPHPPRVSP